MKNLVALKEFHEDVAKYAGRIARGETFVVTKHSRPLFRVEPVEEEGWKTVIDFTQFRKGGIPASDFLKMLESV